MDADDEKSDVSINIGREIGCYRIVRFLGKGGMSEVYEAEHVRLGSRHAVKFFTYMKNVDGMKERFLVEGRLLAKLSHPRIVRVTDTGTDPETAQPYFVMDLITDAEGNVRSLADVPAGGVDETQIAMWYDDLREGLAYIHSKGIIHRDLKLDNVLIGPDDHVVLTDFGISKIGGDEASVVDPVQTVVRLKDGKKPMMGTTGYMAPELVMGAAASPASDYYALGVIVFRLLAGMWCDARTDIANVLETYDPVWRQILPKLLHSHPDGRGCPAWSELKAADEEQRLFELMNSCDRLRDSVRRAWIACASLLAFACVAGLCVVALQKRPPEFEDFVFVPQDVPEEERSTFEDAMPDARELLHDIFLKLRRRRITGAAAAEDVDKLSRNDEFGEELQRLLHAAAERMKERYPEK